MVTRTPSVQVHFQLTAIAALQVAAENFIVGLFEDVNLPLPMEDYS